MNPKPLVSVCIQTFQHVHFIEQCVDSVLNQQTTFPIEIILGEDDSTDGTREICKRYKEKYPDRIRLFLRSENDKIWIDGEKTGRFNFISNLRAARGKYIALLDGDDFWTDNLKLQRQVHFLEAHHGYTLCFCNHSVLKNGKLKSSRKMFLVKKKFTIKNIPTIYTATPVFRNPGFEILPDHFWQVPYLDFALFMFITGHQKIYRLSHNMAVYREHDKGVWTGEHWDRKCLNSISLFRILLPVYFQEAGDLLYRKIEYYIQKLFKIYVKENKTGRIKQFAGVLEKDELLMQRRKIKTIIKRYSAIIKE